MNIKKIIKYVNELENFDKKDEMIELLNYLYIHINSNKEKENLINKKDNIITSLNELIEIINNKVLDDKKIIVKKPRGKYIKSDNLNENQKLRYNDLDEETKQKIKDEKRTKYLEYIKDYKQKNKEKYNEYARNYYKKNNI